MLLSLNSFDVLKLRVDEGNYSALNADSGTHLFWVSVLALTDLALNLSCGKKFSSGFKIYNPHFCACQFGLTQSIPMQIVYSMNFPFSSKRESNTDMICHFEIAHAVLGRLCFINFSNHSYSSLLFDE